jgi:anaerobic nitric oxide reductase transcription regulator
MKWTRHFALHDETAIVAAGAEENENLREATEAFQRQMIPARWSRITATGRRARGRWRWTSPTCTGWRSVWAEGLDNPGLIEILQVDGAAQLACHPPPVRR